MPSTPQTITTQIVFDYIYDTAGKAVANAKVTSTLNFAGASDTSPVVNIGPLQQTTTTDSNGYWQFNLIPNPALTPTGTSYTIESPYNSYSVSVPNSAGPFQSSGILVNVPSVISPALTNLTGPITVTGNETVTGNLTVNGTTTLGSTTTGALSATANSGVSGDLSILNPGRLLLTAPAAKIIPGATSISLRNNADSADNLLMTDAGAGTVRASLTAPTITASTSLVSSGDETLSGRLVMAQAVAKILGGATSLSLRNNADSADNFILTDLGLATLRNAISIPSTAGGSIAPTSFGSIPVKVGEQLLGVSATSFPSISIPSWCRALLILGKAQGQAGTIDTGYQYNGDGANNYSNTQLFATGATPQSSAGVVGNNALAAQAASGSSACWGTFLVLPADATLNNKPSISVASSASDITLRAGYWNQSTAISSVVVVGSASIAAGSYVAIWGLP